MKAADAMCAMWAVATREPAAGTLRLRAPAASIAGRFASHRGSAVRSGSSASEKGLNSNLSDVSAGVGEVGSRGEAMPASSGGKPSASSSEKEYEYDRDPSASSATPFSSMASGDNSPPIEPERDPGRLEEPRAACAAFPVDATRRIFFENDDSSPRSFQGPP